MKHNTMKDILDTIKAHLLKDHGYDTYRVGNNELAVAYSSNADGVTEATLREGYKGEWSIEVRRSECSSPIILDHDLNLSVTDTPYEDVAQAVSDWLKLF